MSPIAVPAGLICTIQHLDRIEGHCVLDFAGAAAAEIVATYNDPDTYGPEDSDSALFYIDDVGQVISLLIWFPWQGYAFIGTAWTHPEYRRLGLYRALFDRLRYVSASKGLKGITCGVIEANTVSRRTHESFGMNIDPMGLDMQVVYYRMEFQEPAPKDRKGSPRTPARFLESFGN